MTDTAIRHSQITSLQLLQQVSSGSSCASMLGLPLVFMHTMLDFVQALGIVQALSLQAAHHKQKPLQQD